MVKHTPHRGFEYEKNLCEFLKGKGLVKKSFMPAGSNNSPDIELYNGIGCEVKIFPSSAGSLILIWEDEWKFKTDAPLDKEKKIIQQLAKKLGLFETLNEQWGQKPCRYSNRPNYKKDFERFKQVKFKIDPKHIEKYYLQKGSSYMNVGTHGLYLLGKKNPLNYKDVPSFVKSCSDCYGVARVQYKGEGRYQFVFELKFGLQTKSPFNLAPIKKHDLTIIREKFREPEKI